MKEELLFRTALVFSLVGIAILLVLGNSIKLEYSEISTIEKGKVGENIKVKGVIIDKKELQSLYLFKIKDESGVISVVIFKDDKNSVYLKKGQMIEVEGIVKKYKDELEIEANKIII
ncbi:OB-fold nucleic acid binding domain-containing protein [Candidatus Woesearchaeota archaeon]|nr:OB-fold nucleic acid binding domain-containing protein [Candidatus Woesearchaeota archaeon]